MRWVLNAAVAGGCAALPGVTQQTRAFGKGNNERHSCVAELSRAAVIQATQFSPTRS